LDFNVYLEYVINTYEEAGSKFRIHHTIEDIKRWDRPDKPNYDWLELDKKMESFGYLVHLRHYGFPSPLLDWSRSAYKAAFFAFQNPSEGEYVSIYALKRNKYGDGIISSKPEIRVQDYYKNNMENIDDARHRFTLQEGDVTVCLIV
jgi:hypothetical protein